MRLNFKTDNGDAMTDRRSDYLATPRDGLLLALTQPRKLS